MSDADVLILKQVATSFVTKHFSQEEESVHFLSGRLDFSTVFDKDERCAARHDMASFTAPDAALLLNSP